MASTSQRNKARTAATKLPQLQRSAEHNAELNAQRAEINLLEEENDVLAEELAELKLDLEDALDERDAVTARLKRHRRVDVVIAIIVTTPWLIKWLL